MTPLHDYIFVRQDPEREYIGGIIVAASTKIVESQRQLGRYGTVEAIGPDVDKDQLKVGDRICYGEIEYPKGPNGCFILQEADVAWVMGDEPAATV
jgi:co-chaperonin GroES (HSP10)